MYPMTEEDARTIHARTQHLGIHELSREFVETIAWWQRARVRSIRPGKRRSCARPVLA